MKVQATCIDRAWDSGASVLYYPGEVVELDLNDPRQRRLTDLKTPMGEWVFQFDRSHASDTNSGLFFCKNCGMRFDKLNEIGNHRRQLKDAKGNPNPCRVDDTIPEGEEVEEQEEE